MGSRRSPLRSRAPNERAGERCSVLRAACRSNASNHDAAQPMIHDELTWLDVPFFQKDFAKSRGALWEEDKDDARGLGARWDHDARKWFITPGMDPTPFNAWR